MDLLKLSSIISLVVAVAILFANFFQWWNITYDGKMLIKSWVKLLFGISIVLLLVALIFILLN